MDVRKRASKCSTWVILCTSSATGGENGGNDILEKKIEETALIVKFPTNGTGEYLGGQC
jgi:hypothetical protein